MNTRLIQNKRKVRGREKQITQCRQNIFVRTLQ